MLLLGVSKIKKEFINPFIEGAAQIFPQVVPGIEFNRTGLALAKQGTISPELMTVIVLGVLGNVRGRVIYILEHKLALGIANTMCGTTEEPSEELSALARSALSEMTNMVTGRAISILASNGYKVDFSPPTLFVGRDVMIPELDIQAIAIPFQTQLGSLELNVALKEVPEK